MSRNVASCHQMSSLQVLTVVLFALGSNALDAAPISFSFTGQISNTSGDFSGTPWSGVQIGDPFTVDYTFESTTIDAVPDATRGAYAQTISAVSVQIGGASDNNLAFNGSINVYNNHAVEDDYYNATAFLSNNVSMILEFRDTTRSALNSDALPTTLDPATFPVRTFRLTVPAGGFLGGDIAVIPEPSTPLLLVLAAVSVHGLRCRWRKRPGANSYQKQFQNRGPAPRG